MRLVVFSKMFRQYDIEGHELLLTRPDLLTSQAGVGIQHLFGDRTNVGI